jgi:hypothetical protein
MVRILDGDKQQQFFGPVNAPEHQFEVRCWGNSRDYYTVLVSRDGYVGNGYYPVKVTPSLTEVVDLMLIPRKHRFDFAAARWDVLLQSHGRYCELLSALAADAPARWDALLPDVDGPAAADFLNIMTAMRDIHLRVGTPVDYLRGISWDGEWRLQPDRFFTWVDVGLVDEVKRAAAQGQFDQEVNPKLFHAGATLSYKENQMVEANVQLTFHENTTCPSAGFETTILLEPDIDYYPNLLAHGLFEVVPGFFGLTDPRQVYVMRWTASRRIAGIPEFDPPYLITAV